MPERPKEWSPSEEPGKATYRFAGIRFEVERGGPVADRPDYDEYTVTVIGPGGENWEYATAQRGIAKYKGIGHLESILETLATMEMARDDFATYASTLPGTTKEAVKEAVQAAEAANAFDPDDLSRAAAEVSDELWKVPMMRRRIEKGLQDLKRRMRRD